MNINSFSSKADRMEALITFELVGQLAEKIIAKIREERGRASQTGPRAPKGGGHQKAQGCSPARDPRPAGLGRRPGLR
jgi:hypothetical protein